MAAATILVGYDDQDPARRALEQALQDARATGARVMVLAVAEMPLDPTAPRAFGTPADWGSEPRDLVPPAQVERYLDDARAQAADAGVEVRMAWAAGDPAAIIVDAARDLKADRIVVGHHHHGMLGRLLGSDVAAEVRRRAGCEVVVVD